MNNPKPAVVRPTRITGDNEQIAALDIQHYADRIGWGGVRPLTQQCVRFSDTLRGAVVQQRGGFFFAVAFDNDGHPHCTGPGSRNLVARDAIDISLRHDRASH